MTPEDNSPGVLMAMKRPTSLILGISETLVHNWGGQGRLPHVRFEIVRTTLFPTAYMAAIRADAQSKASSVSAEQVGAFNQTPEAQQNQRFARLAFRQLLTSQPSLTIEEVAQLFGFNSMMAKR